VGSQLVFQRGDIELELATPEIGAVPVERSLPCSEARAQRSVRFGERDRVMPREPLGNDLQPEIVVEAQIEQRAIHIEQDGIDLGPGSRARRLRSVVCDVMHRYVNAKTRAATRSRMIDPCPSHAMRIPAWNSVGPRLHC
jgi:hypothetical protein